MSGHDDHHDDHDDDGPGLSVGISLSGRPLNLGEKNPLNVIGGEGTRSRLLYGNVDLVDNNNGVVTGPLVGVGGGLMYATVPPLWFSMTGATAAWGRYMPQRGDTLKIMHGPDNSQHVVGYDTGNTKSDQNSRIPGYGWPAVHEMHKRAMSNPRDKVVSKSGQQSVPIYKYAQFEPLNEGEYDFMSAGGAYIRGFRDGKMYLAGGAGVTISLNKVDMSMMSAAQVFVHAADVSEFRFGQVRRTGPDMIDSKLATDQLGSNREFRVWLKTATAPGVSVDCASLEMGNVATAQGIIDLSFYGAPVKYSYRAHDGVGVQVHRTSIDELGNWRVESTSPGSTAEVQYPSIKFNGTTDFTVNSPSVKFNGTTDFTVNSPSITLSGPSSIWPTYPTILSTPYRSAEDSVISALALGISELSAQVLVLNTALASVSASVAVLAVPPLDALPVLGGVLAGIFAPIGTAAGVVAASTPVVVTTTNAAVTAFTAASPAYVSTFVKNG